jgi:deoxycytidylate deaminase
MTDSNNNLQNDDYLYIPKKKINKKHINYFNMACDLAYKSNMYKNYGAIIVYNKKIIGRGHNYSIDYFSKSHNYIPIKYKYLQNVHAEEAAIENAIRNGYKYLLHKCDIYIIRIENTIKDSRSDILTFKQSVPCCKCKCLIEKYNFRKAFYIIE